MLNKSFGVIYFDFSIKNSKIMGVDFYDLNLVNLPQVDVPGCPI